MKRSHRNLRAPASARAAIALAAALTLLPAQAVQITAIWTGAVNGNYGTAGNWNINVVPLNDASNTYNVQIGPNKSVVYSVLNPQTIDQFLLDTGSGFQLLGTSLIQPTDLAVLGQSLIAGSISANNATFRALGTGTSLLGNSNVLAASNGGQIFIDTPVFSAKALTASTILSAVGTGSRVDVLSAQSLDVGSPRVGGAYVNTVRASDQGQINLPAVKTVIAPASNADWLSFDVRSGGRLNLSSLQRVSGPSLDTGNTQFIVDGATALLGPVQLVNRATVSLANSATMSIGGFAGSALISNTTFSASSGAQLNAATLRGEFNARGLTATTLLSATGQGTRLDLSGLQLFDSGSPRVGGAYTNTVAVSDRASIDLSGVSVITAPASNADHLRFSAISGTSLNLASLRHVSGLTFDTGNTDFYADAASFTLGPLEDANRMSVDLQNGATMSVGGFNGTAAITNSTFNVVGGARLNAATLRGTYNVRGFQAATFLNAAGTGSVMDLSGLSLIDVGSPRVGGAYSNNIAAADGARINLSGVTALVAPASNADYLTLSVITGGQIDLSALRDMAGLTLDTGNTRFTGDNGSFVLGAVQRANRWQVALQNGATMQVGGAAVPASVTNSLFSVASGARLDASTLVGNYQMRAYTAATLMSATGPGSVLNLSGLQVLDAGTPRVGGAYNNTISASDKAAINLSGVKTLVTPDSAADGLVFAASSQGTIDLSSLRTVTSAAGGRLQFSASTGGRIVVGGFAAGPGVSFGAVDPGSSLGINGSLSLLTGSTLAAAAGTRIDISGDFSFQQTVEAQVNTDLALVSFSGAGSHTLEVGGRRASSLPAMGAVVTNNFAIGQLSVGQDGVAETLVLVDAIDNGNRSSPEVLYLNGAAGANGLRIQGGSTVLLSNVDLYFTENGNWVHANDLFQNGATTIAYDQGFISLVPEPGSVALLLAGLGVVGLRRRQVGERE